MRERIDESRGLYMNEKTERLRLCLVTFLVYFITLNVVMLYIQIWGDRDALIMIYVMCPSMILQTIAMYVRSNYRTFKIDKTDLDNIHVLKMLKGKRIKKIESNKYKLKNSYSIRPIRFTIVEHHDYFEIKAPELFKRIIKKLGVVDINFK